MSQEQITQETVPVAETTETPTEAPKQETQIEQPVVAKSWKEAIPEELRNDPNIAKFTELESLAKSYVNATRMIGQDKVACLLYTSPSPRDLSTSRMPSSA